MCPRSWVLWHSNVATPTHALALRLVDKYAIDLTTDGVDVAKYDDDTQGGCIFDVIDANSDGDLDVDELVDFLVSFSCGTDEIVALLSRLPRDADGGYHVTREYFVRYFAPFWRFLFPLYVEELEPMPFDDEGELKVVDVADELPHPEEDAAPLVRRFRICLIVPTEDALSRTDKSIAEFFG